MVPKLSSINNNVSIILLICAIASFCMSMRADNEDIPANAPPEGSILENWTMLCFDLHGFYHDDMEHNVAVANDSIYFRVSDIMGFAGYYRDIDSWVRGRIEGNKVIIDRDLPLSTWNLYYNPETQKYETNGFGGYAYFNPCEFWDNFTEWQTTVGVRTVEGDLVFDYDSERKWLHNPSSDIWISENKKDIWDMSGKEAYVGIAPVYTEFELVHFPEGPLTPQPPEFLIETCPNDGKKYVILNGSIVSQEGPLMDDRDLCYRVYIDGEPYIYETEKDGTPIYDIDFRYRGSKTSRIYNHIGYVHIPYDPSLFTSPIHNVYAELVYKYEDGLEVVSARAPLVDVSGVDEVFRDDVEDIDAPVYDLSGRRVNPKQLAPGIYIRNGKKFLVR